MASPGQSTLFSTFTELVTTTYRNHKKEIANNIEAPNVLLKRLNDRGNKRMVDGGLSIVCPLDYAANSTIQRYSGYDTLNVAASDVISAAEFPWKQMAGNVVASGLELRTNSGKSALTNLAKARMKNLIRSMSNTLAVDIYSDGTASNQINGLQALVSDAGTGTVGGINSTTFSFWRSILQSAAAPLQGGGAITPSATTIESLMAPLYYRLTRGTDQPNLIVMDEVYFGFFEQSQVSLKRYAPTESNTKGDAGFVSLKYKGADVVLEGNGIIPASHSYFLNLDYLEWCVHPDADYQEVPEMRPVNQDAFVMPIIWQGNLTVNARKYQGVMKA